MELAEHKENQIPAVFYYVEVKKEWAEVTGGKIEGNRIVVEVDHFTKFAVFAVDQTAAEPAQEAAEPGIVFSDIAGHWAKRAVALAVQAGILSGYEDGNFRPDAPITRAEMASMVAKALKVPLDANAQTGFADNEDIPKWAKGAVEAILLTYGCRRIAHFVGDTALDIGFGVYGAESFFQTGQPIKDTKQHFMQTTAMKVFQNLFPACGAFSAAHVEARISQ